jgi:hypothetical protein
MSYRRRLLAERRLLQAPPAKLIPILSDNHKTGASVNLPVLNCRPTKRCAAACYACVGPIAWCNSLRKALAVDLALRKGEVEGLVWECRRLQDLRLNGSGDMSLAHVPAVLELARKCPATLFWGFTRRREVAEAVNQHLKNLSLIVSFDATSADRELAGCECPLAFGPRRPRDEVPNDRRIIVVFPEHHVGHTIPGVPLHPKDCPATRGAERTNACQRCQRCWRPFAAMDRKELSR